MSLLSNRHARGHHVSDIALDVRVDSVLPRAPHALYNLAKFFPVARFAQPVVAVREPARFRGGPAQCVGFFSLAKNDGPVARHGNLQVFVRQAFDVDRLVDDLRLRPRALHAILIRRGRIKRLNVKILNVGAVIGEAPGDAVVVADDDHGGTGQGEPFDIPARCGEVNFIPD